MAAGVPPPPLNSPTGSYYWLEWYTNLTNFLNGTNIPWSNINFTSSNIADIQTRDHNSLQAIQGGNASGTASPTGNAWHFTGKGYVDATGVGTGMPPSWLSAHTGTGVYTITHNLGLAAPQLGAIATSNTVGNLVQWIDVTNTNTIIVHTTNFSGTATDSAFTFTVST
jgi:hypothetical protein